MGVPRGYVKEVRSRDDVAAGPGDAGLEDRAELRDDAPAYREKGRQATWLFVGLVVAGFVAYAVLAAAG